MAKHASNSSSSDPATAPDSVLSPRYNQGLTPLHPPHENLLRTQMILRALILLILASVAETLIYMHHEMPAGLVLVPAAVIAFLTVAILPHRIYRRWGYDMGDAQLRVLRGYLWRTDTIVPFNRIQHIDVAQGPLQRFFGLSTLIVHTAGTHNSIVTLPGLATADAEEMRDTIKGHIRQDMI